MKKAKTTNRVGGRRGQTRPSRKPGRTGRGHRTQRDEPMERKRSEIASTSPPTQKARGSPQASSASACLPLFPCSSYFRVILLGVFDRPVVDLPPLFGALHDSLGVASETERGEKTTESGMKEQKEDAQTAGEECVRGDETRSVEEPGAGREAETKKHRRAAPLFTDADGDLVLVRRPVARVRERNVMQEKAKKARSFSTASGKKKAEKIDERLAGADTEGAKLRSLSPSPRQTQTGGEEGEETHAMRGQIGEIEEKEGRGERCREAIKEAETTPALEGSKHDGRLFSRSSLSSPPSVTASSSPPSASLALVSSRPSGSPRFSCSSPQLVAMPFAVCQCASPTAVSLVGRQLWTGGLLLVNFLLDLLLSGAVSSCSSLLTLPASDLPARLSGAQTRRRLATGEETSRSSPLPAPLRHHAGACVSTLQSKNAEARRHSPSSRQGAPAKRRPSRREEGEDIQRDRGEGEKEAGEEGQERQETKERQVAKGDDLVERGRSLTILELGCGVGLLGGALPSILEAVDHLRWASKQRQPCTEETEKAPASSHSPSSPASESRSPSSGPSSGFASAPQPLCSPVSADPSRSCCSLCAVSPARCCRDAPTGNETRGEEERRPEKQDRQRCLDVVNLLLTDADEGALAFAAATVCLNGGKLSTAASAKAEASDEEEDDSGKRGEGRGDQGEREQKHEEGREDEDGKSGAGEADEERGVRKPSLSLWRSRHGTDRYSEGRQTSTLSPSSTDREGDTQQVIEKLLSRPRLWGVPTFSFGASERNRRLKVTVRKLVWGSGHKSAAFSERPKERPTVTTKRKKGNARCPSTEVAETRQGSLTSLTELKEEEISTLASRRLQARRQTPADNQGETASGEDMRVQKTEGQFSEVAFAEKGNLLILAADALYDYKSCDGFAVEVASLLRKHRPVRKGRILRSSSGASCGRSPYHLVESPHLSSPSRWSYGVKTRGAFLSSREQPSGAEKRARTLSAGDQQPGKTRAEKTNRFQQVRCFLCHTRRVGISCPTSTVPVDVFAEYFRERFVRNVVIAGEVREGEVDEGDEKGDAAGEREERGRCRRKEEEAACETRRGGDFRGDTEMKRRGKPPEAGGSDRDEIAEEERDAGSASDTSENSRSKIRKQRAITDTNPSSEPEEQNLLRKRRETVRLTDKLARCRRRDGSPQNLIAKAEIELGPPPWFDLVLHKRPPIRIVPLTSVLLPRGDNVSTCVLQPCSQTKLCTAPESCCRRSLSRKGSKGGGPKNEPAQGAAERQSGQQTGRSKREKSEEESGWRISQHDKEEHRRGAEMRSRTVSTNQNSTQTEGTFQKRSHCYLGRIARRHRETAVDGTQRVDSFVPGDIRTCSASVETQLDMTRDGDRKKVDGTAGRNVSSDLGQFLHANELTLPQIDKALLSMLPCTLKELLDSQWKRVTRVSVSVAGTEGYRKEEDCSNNDVNHRSTSMEHIAQHSVLARVFDKDEDETSDFWLFREEESCLENRHDTEHSSQVTRHVKTSFDESRGLLQFSHIDQNRADTTGVVSSFLGTKEDFGGSPRDLSTSSVQIGQPNRLQGSDSGMPPTTWRSASWLSEALKMAEVWELRLCEDKR
ncbi:hypothetical protein TGDOM2_238930 [Toxoplasma gondii GAB2-2007-GAL-DOM2]|uniref:Uncharacterized protein n=4 Tax=Toxoplasma gondii TaxID=5811 RepID=A0A086KUH1_TOXGO|nr:hypothetical protein TGRH88_031870 [Toxoplasma gondii]KFG39782.1 hypothetical protein TGDOM2_238930 [Toxoplasma gondii GAB2-2007-GAL-DOM2]KFG48039.1 hypothetical protein TGFOU_238930 [Toxoplasma gondii FOU]RQX70690.1 hypothetical protein TGCAST_238930 [Toxoplasma gondii CAST]